MRRAHVARRRELLETAATKAWDQAAKLQLQDLLLFIVAEDEAAKPLGVAQYGAVATLTYPEVDTDTAAAPMACRGGQLAVPLATSTRECANPNGNAPANPNDPRTHTFRPASMGVRGMR